MKITEHYEHLYGPLHRNGKVLLYDFFVSVGPMQYFHSGLIRDFSKKGWGDVLAYGVAYWEDDLAAQAIWENPDPLCL